MPAASVPCTGGEEQGQPVELRLACAHCGQEVDTQKMDPGLFALYRDRSALLSKLIPVEKEIDRLEAERDLDRNEGKR
jgi:hypothetical protein